jgi:hypothetical protein
MRTRPAEVMFIALDVFIFEIRKRCFFSLDFIFCDK